MRKLLNTLYITTEDAFLALDGGNISVSIGTQKKSSVFPIKEQHQH